MDLEQVKMERSKIEAAADGGCDSPATAALTLIADALGAVQVAEPGALLSECAGIAWLVEIGIAYLAETRDRYDLAAAAGRIGQGG
jgi:hypothetical protein